MMVPSFLAVAPAVELAGLDYLVIVAYLLLLGVIGVVVSLRQRKSEDLFLGGRSLKWYNIGFSIFGTNINPSFLIASCGAGYTLGMVVANYEWMACAFIFLLGMVFVPFYLRTRITTMPEFMRKRFGEGCYTFMSFYALLGTIVLWLGGTLFAGGSLLSQLMAWDLNACFWIFAGVSALLAVSGGLKVIMTADSLQSGLMILGAGLLTVIAATHLESFEALRNVNLAGMDRELTWKLFHHGGGEPWYALVLGYPVIAIWFWCADQTIIQKPLSAENLKQAQLGTIFTGFLKVLPPFIFLMPGIMAAVLLPGIEDDKKVFLSMVNAFLPAGLVGLIVVVLVAAVVSTLSAGFNSFATVSTLDIYKRWINPEAGDHEAKQVGRVVTVLAALLSVGFAFMLSLVKDSNLFNLFQGMIGYMAPPVTAVFLLGVFWKRATATAAVTTLVLGSAISLSIGVLDITNHFQREIEGEMTDIWPHFLLLSFFIFVGLFAMMIVVSLLTKNSEVEEPLPSLRQTYRENPGIGRAGWLCWGALALLMLGIYGFFQLWM
ncbi:MAG: sodium/solute symporter [Verrucomicrobiota bacterium]